MDEIFSHPIMSSAIATIYAAARIHVGLADLAGATPRAYGGAGFAVSGPRTVVSAVRAKSNSVKSDIDLLPRDLKDLRECLNRVSRAHPEICSEVLIRDAPPAHSGFGTKTALLLSAIMAASLACDVELGPPEVMRLSGRGGASGIGVHSFFTGGFVVDVGHPAKVVESFLPSSARHPGNVPPVAFQIQPPSDWIVTLVLPDGAATSGRSEEEFFQRNTPIPEAEARDVISRIYHGVVPALLSSNLHDLAVAIGGLQRTGFKAREIAQQSAEVSRLLHSLAERCEVVGMSSMGPLIYTIDLQGHSATVRAVAPSTKIVGEFHIPSVGHAVVRHD